ncbi:threo-3-hydroxy-L-aspartate ammonia-lyase [Tistrella sp.]|uniref:Threo-3-hydroxy-L-aspartate ammonia-lyase n=1 Tax=Tistrella mobilis TaxID=171437 RepID=A0A3B9IF36_9PROT|nr:threo-3-hydroxy-L-aspartate ammonia-lyase [Tistrella sp.]MAD39628.1 serine dehydratase [Tistrella sp.]HAE46452.1 threo-3-hydroxy-L-aspartate ammonia-lyase [Tistrella mobilis]
MTGLAIGIEDVRAAAARLEGVAHRTPVLTSATADAMTGARLFFKPENLQRMGAFKFRGAYNALAKLKAQPRPPRGVVAFSSGNHAQAVALAGRLLGLETVIVMPSDAPLIKRQATEGYGGEVVAYDRYTQDREAIGREIAEERGLVLIPPFDHADVMAGQGTAALELLQDVMAMPDAGGLDLLFVCVGGGGLISGSAVAAAALQPGCRVIGVEPAAGDDVRRSLAAGEIVSIPTPQTIADGAQTAAPGRLTFPVIRALVDQVITVEDAALVEAMRFFAGRMKLVVEPTGCLAAAGAFSGAIDIHGQRVGVILSGGNVDLGRFAELIGQG